MTSQVDSLDFEIYLLMSMVCDERTKEAKLAEFDVSPGRAEVTKDSVSERLRLNAEQFTNVQRMLGIEVSEGSARTLRFPSLLWPGFEFVIVDENGHWHSARFSRAPGGNIPRVSSPEEFQPWSITVDELITMYGPLRDGDHWPPYEEYLFSTDSGQTYGAGFSWGLLQSIDKM